MDDVSLRKGASALKPFDQYRKKGLPMIKINGWQRIGIVCSGAWVIFIAVLVGIDYSRVGDDRSYEGRYLELGLSDRCLEALMPGGSDKSLEGCSQEGVVLTKIHLKQILIDAFAPMVVMWIAFYLIVYAINWIAAGFRRDG
jgi:hypothetical protein